MKPDFAFCAILCFISFANAFFQGDKIKTLQKMNDEAAAQKLTSYTDSQTFEPDQVQSYLKLLKNSEIMKSTKQKIYIRDFAVKALEEITKVKAAQNSPVKAILSCVKNNRVYRYHIAELNTRDQRIYREKIHNWLLKRIPH